MNAKPGFWRQLLAALRRDTPAFKPEQRPMSPIELYQAGGGDINTTNPRTAALLAEAERGYRHGPRPRTGLHEIRERRTLDHTAPATLNQYLLWLNGFIESGGHPTHYYDYPFTGFVYALSDVMVDSDAEYGSQSRRIIVPRGRNADRTNPDARPAFHGWGHTNLFYMDGYRTNDLWVPVFSDAEFEALLTEEHRKERARQQHETRTHLREALGRSSMSNDEADPDGR